MDDEPVAMAVTLVGMLLSEMKDQLSRIKYLEMEMEVAPTREGSHPGLTNLLARKVAARTRLVEALRDRMRALMRWAAERDPDLRWEDPERLPPPMRAHLTLVDKEEG